MLQLVLLGYNAPRIGQELELDADEVQRTLKGLMRKVRDQDANETRH